MNTSGETAAARSIGMEIDSVYGVYTTLVSLCFFGLVNFILIRQGPPSAVTGNLWRWRNTYVSWIHATIVGVWALYCILYNRKIYNEMLWNHDYVIYLQTAVSEGYFLYDALDHICSGRLLSSWETMIHHGVVLWTFYYSLQHKFALPFTSVALMCEVNSIFLHARKLLQFDNWSFNHWLYRAVAVVNLLTFLIFRLTSVYWICIGIVVHKDHLPFVYWLFLAISMIPIFIINHVLLWRLIKNDLLRYYLNNGSIKTLLTNRNYFRYKKQR